MLLSICIPSHNRGHRALALVEELLQLPYGNELEIICSNNGSDKNTEGYEKLKEIKDERFVYYEFAENRRFVGNVNQVIRLSRGEFCLLLSDEDKIVAPNLDYYLRVIKEFPELGMIKAKTSTFYNWLKNAYEPAGEKALGAFYMNGNYMSGAIYNRKVITNAVVDQYETKYRDNEAYCFYPHMFYEAYAMVYSDFFSGEIWLVDEGKAEDDLVVAEKGPDQNVAEYGTYEKRMAQMHGFAEQIRDMEAAASIKFQMFIMLCEKTSFLIKLNKEKYEKDGYDWKEIMGEVTEKMKKELELVQLPVSPDDKEVICEFIDEITAN